METWFKTAQCSECEEHFEDVSTYCAHLNGRFTQGQSVTRWLRGITFGGAGIVERPADIDATSISVAETNKTRKQLFAEILKQGSHDLFSGDIDFIVSLIGTNLKNFEDVLEAWIESLEDNELVDMSVVNTRVKEIINNILTDDSSSANLSKGGQLTVAYTFESKEDLVNSKEVQEAFEDKIEKRVTEELSKQDKEGKISEMTDKLKDQEAKVVAFEDKVKNLETKMKEDNEKVKKEKQERELSELADTRFNELTEAGVVYSEDRIESTKERLKVMSDEDYAEYKEDVTANLPASDPKKKKIEAKIPLIPNKVTAGIEEEDYLKNIGVALSFKEPVFSDKELKN